MEDESDANKLSESDDDDEKQFSAISSKPLPPPDAEGWIHVTEDGGIKKKILVEGSGNTPKSGADVSCHYVGTLVSDGTKFDSSRDRDEPFSFPINRHQVIRGWDIGIATMKKGEKCILRCRHDYAYGERGQGSIPPKADLDFEVELLDWSSWKNAKNGIKKQILVDSEKKEHMTPDDDAKCNISYVLKLDDENGKTIDHGENVEFVVDDDDKFPAGFHDAVKEMKRKSQVEFKIPSEHMWGEQGFDKFNVPPNANIYANITLNDFQNMKTVSEMSAQEKYDESQRRKQLGNDLFKNEKYNRAIKRYTKSLELINDLNDDEYNTLKEKYEKEINDLKLSCNNNLAMTYLKLKDYRNAIDKSNEAIKIDNHNIKAFTRRGQALFLERELEDAESTFIQALALNPSPQEAQYINHFLKQVKQKIKFYRDQEKKRYSKMFK